MTNIRPHGLHHVTALASDPAEHVDKISQLLN